MVPERSERRMVLSCPRFRLYSCLGAIYRPGAPGCERVHAHAHARLGACSSLNRAFSSEALQSAAEHYLYRLVVS